MMSPSFLRFSLCLFPLALPLSEAYAQEAATLAPVVVTGTRTERALDDVPVRVEVGSREEITRTHARTLKEALENVPGLQLREVHGKSGFELSLQGLTSDQVLVLIDGLPISASTGSTVDLSQYLVSDVARIEVVKGASSAQYGSSAMGGVVNVITRPIEQGFGGSATVDVGSYGSQNDNGRSTSANNRHGRINLGGGGETWRLALSGDSMDGDGFGLDPQKWARQGDASKRQQLTARAQWLPRKEGNFWVELGHYTEDDVQRYEYFVPPKYVPQRKTEDITRDRVTFGGDWKFDNGLRAEVKGVSERYDSQSREYSQNFQTATRASSQQKDHITTQLELPAWGHQLWMVGADWSRETLAQSSNGKPELGVAGRAERTSQELFLQNDIVVNDVWEVLLGVRGQDDSDFGTHVAPKVSVRGNVYEQGGWKGVVRASLGQGYRVPNLKERHYLFDHSSLGYVVIGNPNLKPESSDSLQLGGTLGLDESLSIDGNFFYNRVKDMIQTDLVNYTTVNGISAYTYQNIARARTSGLESSVKWRATPALDLQAAYTRTQTRDLNSGTELTRRPRDIVRLGLDWKPQAATTLSVRARYQGDELVDSAGGTRSPAWSTMDVTVNHKLGNDLTLFLGVNNLTNRQRNFASANDFGPIAGRFVYVGAKYAFGNANR